MALVHNGATANLSQALRLFDVPTGLFKPCASSITIQPYGPSSRRQFSTSPRTKLEEKYFPRPHNENIKITPPAWPHPVYTEQQMSDIQVAHKQTKTWSDWTAITMVRLLRFGMDTATGYSHPTEEAKQRGSWMGLQEMKSWFAPSSMTERKWLVRFLFLESVAGVPGMVAASVRHLHSIRRLKRDNGW